MKSINIIDAFYHLKKVEGKKTKFICTQSTGNYKPFESKRNKKGELVINFSDFDYTRKSTQKKKEWRMSISGEHVTKIRKIKDEPNKGFGDVIKTKDMLLFLLTGDIHNFTEIKVFIAKGKKNLAPVVTLFSDNELGDELQSMTQKAKTE